MSGFRMLLRLQWKMFRNSVRDRGPAVHLVQAVLIGAGLAGITWILQRFVFSRMVDIFLAPEAWIVYTFLLLYVFMVVLLQGLKNLIPHYYKSSDLTWLVTTPMPADQIFVYMFLSGNIKAVKGTAFISLPFLLAACWAAGMQWFYLPLLLILIFIFTLIPSALAVLTGMAALRVMSVKVFGALITILNLIVMASFWIGMWNTAIVEKFIRFLFSERADLIPVVSAGKVMDALAVGNLRDAVAPGGFLLAVAAVVLALTFLLSRLLFYQGWLNVQSTTSTSTSRRHGKAFSRLLPSLVFSEWKFALRNQDLIPGLGMMLGIFAVLIIPFARGTWFGDSPEVALIIVMLAAVALPALAVVVMFTPVETATDKALLKGRFQLTKALAISSETVFAYRMLRVALPAALLGGIGLVILSLFLKVNPGPALAAMLLLQFGFAAVHESTELYYYAKLDKSYPILGEFLCWAALLFYLLIAAGPLVLWALQDIFVIFFTPSLPMGALILVAASVLFVWGCRKLSVYSWDEMEFW